MDCVLNVSVVKCRATLKEIFNKVHYDKEYVSVSRNGQDLVGIVPTEDVALLLVLDCMFGLDEVRQYLHDRA